MRFLCAISLFILFSSSQLNAADEHIAYMFDRSTPPEHIVDIIHVEAHVEFEPFKHKVSAHTIFETVSRRSGGDSVIFFAPDFEFTSVKINNKDARNHFVGNNIVVFFEETLKFGSKYKIEFEYSVVPEQGGIFFVGWNDTTNRHRKQIWAHRPDGWLPMAQDLVLTDFYIKFDKGYKVMTNGIRVDVKNAADGDKIWHYQMKTRHPYFSTALVIGKYEYKTLKTKSGLSEELWYYPEYEDRFDATYEYSTEMIDFFEEEFGAPYPYELYRQAPLCDYMYGAMETTTATVFGDFMHIDRHGYWQRNYINVNAHELAHQWFGNCLSHEVQKNVWLTESFATYFAKVFEHSVFGDDYYQNDRRKEQDRAFTLSKRNDYPLGSSRAGSPRWYQKGSLVMDMLRDVLGDEEFRAVIKHYFKKNHLDYVESQDFTSAVFDVTGRDISWFFDQWLYKGGEPKYSVKTEISLDKSGKRSTFFHIEQIHKQNEFVGLYKMPIVFEVHYKDGSFDRVKKFVENQYTVVEIPNLKKIEIDYTLFDPGRRVMKTVEFDKSFEELSAQAIKAKNMIDRYDALAAMRKQPFKDKNKLFNKIMLNEKFYLLKKEIVSQTVTARVKALKRDNADYTHGDIAFGDEYSAYQEGKKDYENIMRTAFNDSDPQVRLEAAENAGRIESSLKQEAEKMLDDISNPNISAALELLCRSFPDETEKYLELTKEKLGWRGLNIRMAWLKIALEQGKSEYYIMLEDYASLSFEFETRMNAINILKAQNYLTEASAYHILEASTSRNNKVRNVAIAAIKYFAQQTEKNNMFHKVLKESNLSAKQKTAIRRYRLLTN